MGRARGAYAKLAGVFEGAYGTPPTGTTNYRGFPFVSSALGAEQALQEDDLLGQGREGYDPTYDVVTNDGDILVPLDARYFGFWLKLLLGAPTTSDSGSASGSITFSAQPAATSTVTIAGVVITFVASGASGSQVNIGANVNATVAALQAYLAGVGSGALTNQTYAAVGPKLTITANAAGLAGNAVTLAASGTSNGTVSAATLSGGTRAHVFASGGASLPSMSIETQHPDVPSYAMSYGVLANMLKIQLQRTGKLNATVSCIAKGETKPDPATLAGTLMAALQVDRFAQAVGTIKRNSVQLGSIVSSNINFTNNYDKVETIQPDGEIEGADAANARATGSITAKFSNLTLAQDATNKAPVDLQWSWAFGAFSLTIECPRVYLPRAKRPISGPGGVQADYNWQASGQGAPCMTVTLVNDQTSY